MAESLAEFFLTNFQAHRDERAYGQRRGYRMEWFTCGQVLGMALRFGKELEARGIGKGERVMLWGENCAEWVAAFFGCALCGVVVVPMDDGAAADFAGRVAGQVGARLWVCSRRHAADLGEDGVVPAMVFEEVKIPTLSQRTRQGRGTRVTFPDVVIGRDDTLQIVFTSGTTAEPKGVVITHGNVLANIEPFEREMRPYLKYERWVHPVRFLNLLPLSHVFGQFLGMFLPPLLGGTVIFQEELKPSEIVSTIRRERVSVLVSVPRVLQSLKQKIERDLEDGAAGRKKIEDFRRRFRTSEGKHFSAAVVDFPRDSAAVRLEILGFYLRRSRAGCGDRTVLGSAGLCDDPGLWSDGDDFSDQRESSVQVGERVDWEGAAGAGSKACGRWGDFDPRRRSGGGILGSSTRAELPTNKAGTAPETWVRSMRPGIFISKGARKK